MALDETGKLFIAGQHSQGPLEGSPLELVEINEFNGEPVVYIEIHNTTYFAITNGGNLYTWGTNEQAMLGHISTTMGSYHKTPTQVTGALEDEIVVNVAAGNSHVFCTTESGNVYQWGYDGMQQTMTPKLHDEASNLGFSYSWVSAGQNNSFAVASKFKMTVSKLPIPYPFGRRKKKALSKLPWYPHVAFICDSPVNIGNAELDFVSRIRGSTKILKADKVKGFGNIVEAENLILERSESLTCVVPCFEWFENALLNQPEGQTVFLLPFCMTVTVKRKPSEEKDTAKSNISMPASSTKTKRVDPLRGNQRMLQSTPMRMPISMPMPMTMNMPMPMTMPTTSIPIPMPTPSSFATSTAANSRFTGLSFGPAATVQSAENVSSNLSSFGAMTSSASLGAAAGTNTASKMFEPEEADSAAVALEKDEKYSGVLCRLVHPLEGGCWTVVEMRASQDLMILELRLDARTTNGLVSWRKRVDAPKDFGNELKPVTVICDNVGGRVDGYVGNEVVASLNLQDKPQEMVESKDLEALVQRSRKRQSCVMLTFVGGLLVEARDAALWKECQDKTLVNRIDAVGFKYVAKDLKDALRWRNLMQLFDFDDHRKVLTNGIVLEGKGVHETRIDTSKKKEGESLCYNLKPESKLNFFVTVSKSWDSWTAIIDFQLETLPKKGMVTLFSTFDEKEEFDDPDAKPSFSITVNNNGKFNRKPEGQCQYAGFAPGMPFPTLVRPKTWYRLIVSGTQQVSSNLGFGMTQMANTRVQACVNGKDAFPLTSVATKLKLSRVSIGAVKNRVGLKIGLLQIWPRKLSSVEASLIDHPLSSLPDPIEPKNLAKSLVGMGFPMHWCLKSLERNKNDLSLACEWLRKNEKQLKEDDQAAEKLKKAQNLSLTGFPLVWCKEALCETNGTVEEAMKWLLSHYDELTHKQ
eukprot:1343318-Amorphochlora_amoeboformis.AAC.1